MNPFDVDSDSLFQLVKPIISRFTTIQGTYRYKSVLRDWDQWQYPKEYSKLTFLECRSMDMAAFPEREDVWVRWPHGVIFHDIFCSDIMYMFRITGTNSQNKKIRVHGYDCEELYHMKGHPHRWSEEGIQLARSWTLSKPESLQFRLAELRMRDAHAL